MVFFQSVSTTGGSASATATIFAPFRGYCGVDVERIIDPRHSGPAGGGWMKSEVGHRKYVFVTDMALRFGLRFRAFLQAFKTPNPWYLTNLQVICTGLRTVLRYGIEIHSLLPRQVIGPCHPTCPSLLGMTTNVSVCERWAEGITTGVGRPESTGVRLSQTDLGVNVNASPQRGKCF